VPNVRLDALVYHRHVLRETAREYPARQWWVGGADDDHDDHDNRRGHAVRRADHECQREHPALVHVQRVDRVRQRGDRAMRRWGWALVLAGVLAACSVSTREHAIATCRQAGYLGAVEDAGLWYCFKDRLGPPPVVPAKTP
jgi:hypothetical protein